MSRRNLLWLLAIAAINLFGLTVSYSAPSRERDKDYELVGLVVDVLHQVRDKYVIELSPERERKLVEDMLNGGLERLDPHSAYINPQEYKQFDKQSEGKFGGVGISVGPDRQNRGLIVISPMVGTPAYEAGVLAGDLIVKIDGKSTENMRMNEAVDLIQGDPGQKVVLTVLHEGGKEPVDIPIVRAVIKVPCVLGDCRKPGDPKEWDFFIDQADKIGYIRLTSFSKTAGAEMRAAIEGLERDGVRGLVLDLRNNPGGLLRAAVEISDLFLDKGVIVSTKGRNHREEVYTAKEDNTLLRGHGRPVPLVVLINKYSASASEIVAAALQDHGRAVVVGERSYGKGSVQHIILMEHDSSALKLTTASYRRPSGKNIHRFPDSKDTDDWGVRPNDSGFRLTPAALGALRADHVPEAVLDKLKALPDKRFLTEKEYLDELAKLLNEDELGKYKARLLAHADRGFEVPMTDEERVQYMVYRNDRDVVRTRPKPAPTGKKDGKPKKDFQDRALMKALDYLKKEIEKQAALLPLEARDA